MIYTYKTLAGARRKRRAIDGVIIRILTGRCDLFVVTRSFFGTKIRSVADDGVCLGSIDLPDLAFQSERVEP